MILLQCIAISPRPAIPNKAYFPLAIIKQWRVLKAHIGDLTVAYIINYCIDLRYIYIATQFITRTANSPSYNFKDSSVPCYENSPANLQEKLLLFYRQLTFSPLQGWANYCFSSRAQTWCGHPVRPFVRLSPPGGHWGTPCGLDSSRIYKRENTISAFSRKLIQIACSFSESNKQYY